MWEPKIQQANEFSLSQLWILGGSFGEDLNSIEAGWQVLQRIWHSDLMSLVCSFLCQVNADIFLSGMQPKMCVLTFMWCLVLVHQVSHDLYGHNNTILFTYWTVSLTKSVPCAYIINLFQYLIDRHSWVDASTQWLMRCLPIVYFAEWCISGNRAL